MIDQHQETDDAITVSMGDLKMGIVEDHFPHSKGEGLIGGVTAVVKEAEAGKECKADSTQL